MSALALQSFAGAHFNTCDNSFSFWYWVWLMHTSSALWHTSLETSPKQQQLNATCTWQVWFIVYIFICLAPKYFNHKVITPLPIKAFVFQRKEVILHQQCYENKYFTYIQLRQKSFIFFSLRCNLLTF